MIHANAWLNHLGNTWMASFVGLFVLLTAIQFFLVLVTHCQAEGVNVPFKIKAQRVILSTAILAIGVSVGLSICDDIPITKKIVAIGTIFSVPGWMALFVRWVEEDKRNCK